MQFSHKTKSPILSAGVSRAAGVASALLDLRAAEGLLDVGQGHVPVDLVKHLLQVARLAHQERALAIGHGLEELHGKATRGHLGGKPDPALAIVRHLLGLVDAVANTALADKHRVRHLGLEALHADLDVLLADAARGRALPQSRVALEALRGELAVEELDDEFCGDSLSDSQGP
eukprot:UN3241